MMSGWIRRMALRATFTPCLGSLALAQEESKNRTEDRNDVRSDRRDLRQDEKDLPTDGTDTREDREKHRHPHRP